MNVAQMLMTPTTPLETWWRRTSRKVAASPKVTNGNGLTKAGREAVERTRLNLQSEFPNFFTSGDICIEFNVTSHQACRWCAQMVKHGYATQIEQIDEGYKKSALYGWVDTKDIPQPKKTKEKEPLATPSLDKYHELMGNERFTPYMLAHKAEMSSRVVATILCRYVKSGKVTKIGRIGECKRNVWYKFTEK